MRWSALPLVLLTSAACGAGQRFVLEEPRSDTFVRVVVAFSGTTKEVTVLEGDAPYEVSLNEELRRGDAFALWVHRYSKAALLHRLPGLEGLSAAEVVAALKPRFDPLPQSHALVPVTPEVLYAEVQADTVGPVVYQVRPYSSWQREISDHPERAFTLDVPEALVCRGVSHEQIQLPAGGGGLRDRGDLGRRGDLHRYLQRWSSARPAQRQHRPPPPHAATVAGVVHPAGL